MKKKKIIKVKKKKVARRRQLRLFRPFISYQIINYPVKYKMNANEANLFSVLSDFKVFILQGFKFNKQVLLL